MQRTWRVLVLIGAVGCGESAQRSAPAGDYGGTLVVSATQDPGTLFPPLVTSLSGRQITEQIYDYLADVGPGLNTHGDAGFRRGLSDSWRWSGDSLSIAFHIHPGARWHDGTKVTAHDVVFTHQLNQNQALGGRMLSELPNIDSVTAPDSLTAVFWFHRRMPTQFLDAAAQLLILPAHQLERLAPGVLRDRPPPPVGTGRFRLARWTPNTSVILVADTGNYRGRAHLDRVMWMIYPDFTGAVTRLLGGESDLFDNLRPEDVSQVARRTSLRVSTLPASDYAFLQFNLRDPADNSKPHPLFGDRELRRAIAMSLDRTAMVRNVFDTLAAVPVGPTVRAFPTTDTSLRQLPFDTVRAKAILDSLGWRASPGGMRMRNGRPLKFSVIVPISSLNRMRMAALIQAQLQRVGVGLTIETMDGSAHGSRLLSRRFDSSLSAWHLGSSPDGTRGGWTALGLGRDGSNYGSYLNPVFDSQLDAALLAPPNEARAAFTRAYRTINDDAPAVWLYEPKTVLGIHRRVRTAETRPDAWWFDLADWSIPAGERLPRDRVPLSR